MGFRAAGRDDTVDRERAYQRMREQVMEELRRTFRPEFLNRLDEIITFRPLTSEQIELIVGILIERVRRELRGQNMDLEVTEAAKKLLAKEGFDPTFGARPLRRAIQRLVEDPLSDELLKGQFTKGDVVMVDTRDDHIVFERKREPALAE
jgi:ATP-dependent Clp protease ATP-binding subunit ClpC